MPRLIATSGPGRADARIQARGFEPVPLAPPPGADVRQGVCAAAQGIAEALASPAAARFAGAVLATRCDQLRRAIDRAALAFVTPWILLNLPADLRCMTILEDVGARLCGTDFLFTHALDPIPELPDPLDALARTALADPMTGPARERAARIVADMRAFGAEALVVSRIPGASHCAHEGAAIIAHVADALGVPGIEIEIPGRTESFEPTLRTRLEALVETARSRRTIQPHSTNPT